MSSPQKSAAGDFPFRMTILRDEGTTQDAAGQPTPDFQLWKKVWGGQEINAGREIFNAQQVQPDVTSVITIRYLKGLVPSMQIKPNANSPRALEILAVLNKGGFNVELELWCKDPMAA